MGRVLKRVPLDFDWPIGKEWKGYDNPYSPSQCSACQKSGFNVETQKLAAAWYRSGNADSEGWGHHLEQSEVDALVKEGRLPEFTRTPRTPEQQEFLKKQRESGGGPWLPEPNGHTPTAAKVNEWSKLGLRHDLINRMICVEVRAKRLGFWGYCEVCSGDGHVWPDPESKKKYEAFQMFDPPTGEGFQLWNNTCEESPLSPVFETLEQLATWCESNATTFGCHRESKEVWLEQLKNGFVHHEDDGIIFR